MIKLATVFSGIGAPEEALKQLGEEFEIVFACDNGERELSVDFETIDKETAGLTYEEKLKHINQLYIREVIKQFVHTIVPVTETCFNWYMNFDLIDVPNDMKKLVWEFTIDYKGARSYRKEKDGMLRPNQWQDLTVKVFI